MSSFILRFNAALLACFLGGVVLFILVLPLVQLVTSHAKIDEFEKNLIDFKLQTLRKAGTNRIIITSGSNGYFSINSTLMASTFHRPVVNAALRVNLFRYMLDQIAPLVGKGDVVLMPLEYLLYVEPFSMGKTEACVRIFNDFPLNWSPDWYKALNACPDELDKILVAFRNILLHPPSDNSSSIEHAVGPTGDAANNTKTDAKGFGKCPLQASENIDHIDQPQIERAIAQMKKQGATVILTFPVGPQECIKNKEYLEKWSDLVHEWGKRQGLPVISTPQEHLFTDTCFFDSPFHLHQGCTPDNTKIYIDALQVIGIK